MIKLVSRLIRHASRVPKVMFLFRKWWSFLASYYRLTEGDYHLVTRSGLELDLVDHSGVSNAYVVFIQREYGPIEKSWVVIDVGAHLGIFTIYAATEATTSKIFALEPSAENFEYLRSNVARNGLADRVTLSSTAMSGDNDTRAFYSGKSSASNSIFPDPKKTGASTVPCITLERFLDQQQIVRCDLLKMNCEGAEFEILMNASPLCLQRVIRIRFEYHGFVPGADVARLFAYLMNCGLRMVYHNRYATGQQGIVWFERPESLTFIGTSTARHCGRYRLTPTSSPFGEN